MPAKNPTKMINGVEHRQCFEPGCEEWFPRNGSTARCEKHQKVYRKKYYDNYVRNGRIPNKTPNYFKPETIEKELQGKAQIKGGLYTGCTRQQIEALQTGDVEKLLRT